MSDVPPPPPPPPPPPGFGDYPPSAPGYGASPPQYGAPGYGGPGYGAYGYPTNQREHPSGTTVLVLGIVGLVLGFMCGVGFLLSPFAWVKGHRARKQMDAETGVVWTNRGNITAGYVCGIIGTVLLLLGVVLFGLLILVAIGSGS